MDARDLRCGDVLLLIEGTAAVSAVAIRSEHLRVHNLEVEGLLSFAVGDDGVLVHNIRAGWHHFFLRALGSRTPYRHKSLTYLRTRAHTRVHEFLRKHLAKVRKGGVSMDPWAPSSGREVRRAFSLKERIAELRKFYKGYAPLPGGRFKGTPGEFLPYFNRELREARKYAMKKGWTLR